MEIEKFGAWQNCLDLPRFASLFERVEQVYQTGEIYPPADCVFRAFELTPPQKVRVVILGQDPYHEPGQAHGLAFSVQKGIKVPPSLVNIYKELLDDLNIEPASHGYLQKWAEQGVLLLNTCLTVQAHKANSHKGKGWELFTDRVIELLNEREKPVVFILWGANAKAKTKLITNPNHLILTGAHPSPLSAYNGFYGGKYFSRANAFLEEQGEGAIDWRLE